MPADIAPSPITAMTLLVPPERSRATERIVVALGALGEAGQAAAGAKRADAVAAPGQDLVRVGLMADVPDQPVARRIEDVVDRGGQLDHAKAGAKMAAGDRDSVDGFLAELVGNLPHLFHLEPAQILRRANGVEKGCFTVCGHSDVPIFMSAPGPDVNGLHNSSATRPRTI